jgi:hypothetical protein
MEDELRQFRELIEALAAERRGDFDVPIDEKPGLSRGTLLDAATSILYPRGYQLFKVRVEGEVWIASYRPAGRTDAN